jgi:hypothetical protein
MPDPMNPEAMAVLAAAKWVVRCDALGLDPRTTPARDHPVVSAWDSLLGAIRHYEDTDPRGHL